MEEKKKIKLNLSAIVIFILIIIIVVMGFYIYKLNKDKYYMTIGASQQIEELNDKIYELEKRIQLNDEETIEQDYSCVVIGETINKEISKYIIDIKDIDKKDEASITLYEDNLCKMYIAEGIGLNGVYKIEGEKLIANMILAIGEAGAISYTDINVIYEFEILDDKTIKLINIKDNNRLKDGENSQYKENTSFAIGMTYSNKAEISSNKVILVENAYKNHAWGFQYRGKAIFDDGDIYEWNINDANYKYNVKTIDEQVNWILENASCTNKKVSEKDLEKIKENINKVKNEIEMESYGHDMGANYIVVWNSNKEKIKLKESGDNIGENKSEEAQELIKIIDKYLK